MEEWSYDEVKQYVEESFESFLKYGQSVERATSSVIYEYEDIIEKSPKEGVMIYTAVFNYLQKFGEEYNWFNALISEAYNDFVCDEKVEPNLGVDIMSIKAKLASMPLS